MTWLFFMLLLLLISPLHTLVEVSIAIGPLGEPPPLVDTRDDEIAAALRSQSYGFVFMATLHKIVLPHAWEQPNEFFTTDSDSLGASISSPDNLYMLASFDVGRDEALVIEVEPPETRYWNVALSTHWYETVEHLHRPVSRTLEGVTPSPDGKVRLVVAHGDPGVPNWLDPMGNERGFVTLRWLDSRGAPVPPPAVTRLPRSELAAALGG